MDQDNKAEKSTHHSKRVRHRKKQLYENILQQMEFYFSDANLAKDRFLSELTKEEPYVPLDTFLKFNKIRCMTEDTSDIAKAIRSSSLLECSEDNTKVKRKIPFVPYDADSRTVYVESIPSTASRDWLLKVFGDYGKIVYISLPTFKNTSRIKGFAFIEFSSAEEAQQCLSELTKLGCNLPVNMPPEELSTIKLFSVENPTDSKGDKNNKKDTDDIGEPPRKKARKNKHKKMNRSKSQNEHSIDESKKAASEDDSENKIDNTEKVEGLELQTINIEQDLKPPDSEAKDESKEEVNEEAKEEASSQDEAVKTQEGERKKKNRKRSAKERTKSKNGAAKKETPKTALFGLQVLSKNEWKALRNKYLNLQRKHMKELKTVLRTNPRAQPQPAVFASEINSEIPDEIPKKSQTDEPAMKVVPGLFVKAELPEACLDVRLTKRQVRSNVHVQYVDVKEGSTELLIRFDSPEAAKQYCSSGVSRNARVVSGAEEGPLVEAWVRGGSSGGGKRPRGRDKLLRRAAQLPSALAQPAPSSPQPTTTHMRFPD